MMQLKKKRNEEIMHDLARIDEIEANLKTGSQLKFTSLIEQEKIF